jgi:hypothetical protein
MCTPDNGVNVIVDHQTDNDKLKVLRLGKLDHVTQGTPRFASAVRDLRLNSRPRQVDLATPF